MRGLSHSTRTRHPKERLGNRPECQPRYAGPGRTPAHPLRALAGSEADVEGKRRRAGRGERLHIPADVLDDPSAGLLVQSKNHALVTGEVADTRDGMRRPLSPLLDLLSFGGRVRQLRHDLNLSLQETAQQLRVPTASLARWENNRSSPKMNCLIRLAALFNVPAGALLDGLTEDGLVPC